MRGIQIEMRGEDGQALRVRRLDGEHAAAAQFRACETDQFRNALRRKVLDNLRGIDSIESGVWKIVEIREKVGRFGVEAFSAAEGYRFRV